MLIKSDAFDKDKVKSASKAAFNFSMWIRAVTQTYDALKIVNPKK